MLQNVKNKIKIEGIKWSRDECTVQVAGSLRVVHQIVRVRNQLTVYERPTSWHINYPLEYCSQFHTSSQEHHPSDRPIRMTSHQRFASHLRYANRFEHVLDSRMSLSWGLRSCKGTRPAARLQIPRRLETWRRVEKLLEKKLDHVFVRPVSAAIFLRIPLCDDRKLFVQFLEMTPRSHEYQ